jgi:AbrB family looped-hinge helix DNA binding protein
MKSKETDHNKLNEVKKMPLTEQKPSKKDKWTRVLSERGQTVVPKNIRDYLNVKGGDSLEWEVDNNGDVIVKPKKRKSVLDLQGVAKAPHPIKDMEKAIREAKEERVRQKIREGRL